MAATAARAYRAPRRGAGLAGAAKKLVMTI